MEPEALIELHRVYHEAISNSENDPFRYCFVLDNWKKAKELLATHDALMALGGNKGAKTHLGAWLVVQCAMLNPGSMITCFSQNAETSVLVQQEAVFHYLPTEFKTKVLGQEEYISYTKQNGFAGAKLGLPNGSRIVFKTYSQFTQNQTILEGLDLGSYEPTDVNLGAWLDEYLGGPELIDTLAFRLGQRNAKMLMTFTPIDGYTETVRQFLDGAKTIETKPAELLSGRLLPTVQECKGRDAAILYLHTKDNPFSGYDRIAKDAAQKGEEWILCRVYGVPVRSATAQFPLFSREINVIPHSRIPNEGVTRYMIVDPASRKQWFIIWVAIDSTDTWYIYREWPDVGIGDWAEFRGGEWRGGPGAKRDGTTEGVRQYVDLIKALEAGDKKGDDPEATAIFERYIDPRFGARVYDSPEGSSNLIADLEDAGMVMIPAPGLKEEEGLHSVRNLMAYNKAVKIDSMNRTHFYVSDRCENVIRALGEYGGAKGDEDPWKDPIDCIRYGATAGIRYIDPKWMQTNNQSRGGY